MINFEENNFSVKPSVIAVTETSDVEESGFYRATSLKSFIEVKSSGPSLSEKLALELETEKANSIKREEEWREFLKGFERSIEEVQNDYASWKKFMTKKLSEVAYALAYQILETELQTNPAILQTEIEALMGEALVEESFVIRINSQDKELLTSVSPDFMKSLEEKKIQFEATDRVSRGLCEFVSSKRTLKMDPFRRLKSLQKTLPHALMEKAQEMNVIEPESPKEDL